MLRFSVVIPIYNEEDSITPLVFSLKKVMDELGETYEIIFVDDGSKDGSLNVLKSANLRRSNLVIIDLKKHSGKFSALQAGFDISRGELIITMDGDLQNDPRDIPRILDKIKEGYDFVCGWRYNRKDPWGKLLVSKIARNLRKIIFDEDIHDPGCALRVFKKETLKEVFLFRGAHRFISLIMVKLGFKVGEIKVEHYPRRFGKSKYNIHNRLFETIICFALFFLFEIHRLMRRKTYCEIKEVIRS
jgi:glycosyltransferase involved in cell wall biosynthesis